MWAASGSREPRELAARRPIQTHLAPPQRRSAPEKKCHNPVFVGLHASVIPQLCTGSQANAGHAFSITAGGIDDPP
ncbi:hypothetical protein GCM10023088_52100 [Actinomadura verrucosospora]